MNKKETANLAIAELEKLYPDIECSLKYSKPYELMFATRLAAQCTDARVNIVTKTLFKKYPDLESFANADLEELEQDVKPCGFYHMKAKSLKEMSRQLLDNFGGEVPDNMDDLLTLSGIGRKTANHCIRRCFRQTGCCYRYALYTHNRTFRTYRKQRTGKS